MLSKDSIRIAECFLQVSTEQWFSNFLIEVQSAELNVFVEIKN